MKQLSSECIADADLAVLNVMYAQLKGYLSNNYHNNCTVGCLFLFFYCLSFIGIHVHIQDHLRGCGSVFA